MDYASFEVGDLPVNDPTLEEGAVIVKRSMALNSLVELHRQAIAAEEPDLVPEAVAEKARWSVMRAIHAMAQRAGSAHDVPEAEAEKLALAIVHDLYRTIAPGRRHIQVFLAILPYTTMVVIYHFLDEEGVVH